MDCPEWWYAVIVGHRLGVFRSRTQALSATHGYPAAQFERFSTRAEAEQCLRDNRVSKRRQRNQNGVWFAVAVGRRVGVFQSWERAMCQTFGYRGNSVASFPTKAEAIRFISRHQVLQTPPSPRIHDAEFDVEGREVSVELDQEGRLLQQQMLSFDTQLIENEICVFCAGTEDWNLGTHAGFATLFPEHSGWDVVKRLRASSSTTGIGLLFMAALEAVKRAAHEDPSYRTDMQVFSCYMLTEEMEAFETSGFQAISREHREAVRQVLHYQRGRRIKWTSVGTFESCWGSKWTAIAHRRAREAARGEDFM